MVLVMMAGMLVAVVVITVAVAIVRRVPVMPPVAIGTAPVPPMLPRAVR